MDGLSAGASVIAVVSVALQLVESVKHLYDFWESIEEAPESVRDIAKELNVLSTILASIANPALLQRPNPDMTLVLETCMSLVLLYFLGFELRFLIAVELGRCNPNRDSKVNHQTT